MPGKEGPPDVPSAKRTSPPPALGPDAIAVLEGLTFLYSDANGDVQAGSVGGLLHEDTRYLSEWMLTMDGKRPMLLRSHTVDHYSAAFFLANPELDGLRANSVSIRRLRFVGDGLREEISIHSFVDHPVAFTLRLAIGNDFADLFEVKTQVRDRSDEITAEGDGNRVRFAYAHEGWSAETQVTTSTPADVDGTDFVWEVSLPPRGTWHTTLSVHVGLGDRFLAPRHADFGELETGIDDALARWMDEAPRFECDAEVVEHIFGTSIRDLAALRIRFQHGGHEIALPAAGLPWFMTLFGRDTLITAYQSLWVGPELAQGALMALAFLQGREVNPFKDEEPGKIQHEIRFGELTVLGQKPHSPYYGSTDATQLFLVLMSEYWRWTGDDDFVRRSWDRITDALAWIDTYGDLDGDGFVEYQTRSVQGLGNQCWKDSWDGVQFSDGRIPYLPIAIAEAQGYTYDAKLRVADMAEELFEATEFAQKLRREAADLKDRFNDAFWIDGRGGYYAIGLDGDKRRIDAMTSNMGHLLWSGIVPEDRAKIVAKQLMSDELFSGWGIRTMSTADAGFNPIGYHVGTVWPHDNSIAVTGLAKYGFREEANRISLAMLEAARFTEYRLPEVFAGFGKDVGTFPVPFPTACSPQAWATGAPFLFLRAMLGMHPDDGEIVLEPHIPEEIGRLMIHGMHAFGTHYDVEANGTNGRIRLTH